MKTRANDRKRKKDGVESNATAKVTGKKKPKKGKNKEISSAENTDGVEVTTTESKKPGRKRGRPARNNNASTESKDDDASKDEDNVEWVHCDKCGKWRKLPPDISADELTDIWDCSMNTWKPASASCNADEDKATATTTAIATKKKKEPGASASSTESTSVSDHSSITSPTKTSTESGSNGRKNTPSPSALDDRSNIMGRDDIMGRDASGKSSRRSTPTTKKKALDDESRRKMSMSMTNPTFKKKLKVSFDKSNNKVKEIEYTIDENGAKIFHSIGTGSNDNDSGDTKTTKQGKAAAKQQQQQQQQQEATAAAAAKKDEENKTAAAAAAKKDEETKTAAADAAKKDKETKAAATTAAAFEKKQQEQQVAKAKIQAEKETAEKQHFEQGQKENEAAAAAKEATDEIARQQQKEAKEVQTREHTREERLLAEKRVKDAARQLNDNDSKITSPAGAPSLIKNLLSPKSPSPGKKKQEGKAKNAGDDKEEIDPTSNKEDKTKYRSNDEKEKKTSKGGLSISTKASRAANRNNQLIQIPQMFDEINDTGLCDENKLQLIKKIYDKVKHPAIKFRWDDDEEPITDLSDFLFPLKHVWLTEVECRNLMRDPNETADEFLCYGGYSHLDLASQFTFSKKDDSNWWCPLPASIYEKIVRKKYERDSEIDNILNRNQMIGDGALLKFKVIDFVIFGNNHFSRVYVINAWLILEPCYSFKGGDDGEEKAFMIHTNSMDGLPAHDTVKIGKNIIRFLNEYILEHKISNIRKYNKSVLPIVCFNESQQKDNHTCAFQTLAQRYCAMKTIKNSGPLTRNDFCGILRETYNSDSDSDSDSNSDSTLADRFKYKQSDVKMIKADLVSIVRCLKKIKQTDASSLDDIDFDFDHEDNNISNCDDDHEVKLAEPIKRPKAARVKKEPTFVLRKQGRSDLDASKRKEKQRRKDVADERASKFDGKFNKGEHKNYRSMLKQMAEEPPRRLGEGAATLRSYHDEGHRRGLHGFGDATYKYQRMCRFISDTANATMRPATTLGLIFNPISQHPDFSGKNYAPYRKEPQRLCLCAQGKSGRDERYRLAKDYYENFDKYEVVDNLIDLDLEVMGDRADDLYDFIKKGPKEKDTRNRSCNDDNLESIPKVESSPKNNNQNNFDDDDDEEDVDADLLK